jgi:hypothetical protein
MLTAFVFWWAHRILLARRRQRVRAAAALVLGVLIASPFRAGQAQTSDAAVRKAMSSDLRPPTGQLLINLQAAW